MADLVLEHQDNPLSRKLRQRRLAVAVGVAAAEAVLVLAGVIPWWIVIVLATAAVAAYVWFGRRHPSPTVRIVTWLVAASQLIVVLVPVAIVVAGLLAVVAVVALAAVALTVLLLDRR